MGAVVEGERPLGLPSLWWGQPGPLRLEGPAPEAGGEFVLGSWKKRVTV